MYEARVLPVPALFLLTALSAALALGAPALGMVWDFVITVGSVTFLLPAGFPFAILTGALALACWGRAEPDGRRSFGVTGLGLAGATLTGSYAVVFVLWAPWGGPDAQLALLQDVARLGLAVLALSLPVALPDETPSALRIGAGTAGVLLAPLMLFPASFAEAGVPGALDALPMLLFLLVGLLPFAGPAQDRVEGWMQARRDAWDDWEDEGGKEPQVETMAAGRSRGARPAAAFQGRPASEAAKARRGGAVRGKARRAAKARRGWGRNARQPEPDGRWF